ncbi:MAG: hypothetical protein M1820_006482 [Bogoriella megaspora]|nr:MAG: hypothetical protein M1820_006482 [Bogoriella megaspora]
MPGHIRFGDDELPAVDLPESPEAPSPSQIREDPSDNSDSDDAPEAVTQSSARNRVKAAQQGASKAVESRKAADKEKRKTQAERLQEQAKSSQRGLKRKRALAEAQSKENERSDESLDTTSTETKHRTSKKIEIPDLLPDEILAAERPSLSPTPDVDDKRGASHQPPQRTSGYLEKSLAKKAKPLKDLKRGSLNVRVLDEKNKLLAPRVNVHSRNLLEGMRNGNGRKDLEKRAVKRGFATRSGKKG